jgi:hypothetical protein
MDDGTELMFVLLFRGYYKALYDCNARLTVQLRPRRMRLCCLLRRRRSGQGRLKETEGEVYLDKVDGPDDPETSEEIRVTSGI